MNNVEIKILISPHLMGDCVRLQAVEDGRIGNYTRIEPAVDRFRYDIKDKVFTLVMEEIRKAQGIKTKTY